MYAVITFFLGGKGAVVIIFVEIMRFHSAF